MSTVISEDVSLRIRFLAAISNTLPSNSSGILNGNGIGIGTGIITGAGPATASATQAGSATSPTNKPFTAYEIEVRLTLPTHLGVLTSTHTSNTTGSTTSNITGTMASATAAVGGVSNAPSSTASANGSGNGSGTGAGSVAVAGAGAGAGAGGVGSSSLSVHVWRVSKRYSAFFALHSELSRCANLLLEIHRLNLPSLPPKRSASISPLITATFAHFILGAR